MTESEARTRAHLVANEQPGERIEVMGVPGGTEFYVRTERTRSDRATGAWLGLRVITAVIVNLGGVA